MLRTIELHGSLGKQFGEKHRFSVESIPEVIRALGYQIEGFFEAISEGSFQILRDGKAISEEHIHLRFGKVSSIDIVPVIGGEKGGKSGAGKVILGLVLIAATVITAGAAGVFTAPTLAGTLGPTLGTAAGLGATAFGSVTFGQLAAFGALIAAGGIAQILSPTPEVGDNTLREAPDQRASFLLNSQVNTVEEGGAVPLIYGKTRVGSTVVSAGLFAQDIDTTLSGQVDSDFFTEMIMVLDEGSTGLHRGYHAPTQTPRYTSTDELDTQFGNHVSVPERGLIIPEDFSGELDPGTVNNASVYRVYEYWDTAGALRLADSVVTVDASIPSTEDHTNDFNGQLSPSEYDVFPDPEDIGDYFQIGLKVKFEEISIDVTVGGVGGVVSWQYWNGSSWANLSGVTDNTNGFTTTGVQTVTWTRPSNWDKLSSLYLVRARVTTVYSTNPRAAEGTITVASHQIALVLSGSERPKDFVDSLKIEDDMETVLFDKNTDFADLYRPGVAPLATFAHLGTVWIWEIDELAWQLPVEGSILTLTLGYST